MGRKKDYTGIDCFRWAAALLVVAIHTSPFASFTETGDFILTRIIARVAVPFFLMTSGFFLITRYSCDAGKLKAFVKKMALIYGAAILLYLPVNLYTEYRAGWPIMDCLLPNLLKDIVFDGTMYHLWYMPASILGAVIAWYAVRRLGYVKALGLTGVLYLIGLFGDSYYGLAEQVPVIRGFYDVLFQVSDYTRNGVFFTPIFFVMGGLIAEHRDRFAPGLCLIGFAACFALMFGEAMLLHRFNLQRHDSMYLFLLPCMYFLFRGLLFWRGRRKAWFSTAALTVYIIHPMMIIGVRGVARVLHLWDLLVVNSLVHYLAVSAASVAFAVLAALLWERRRQVGAGWQRGTDRAWIELDPDHLAHNVKVLEKAMPEGSELMAVVKAAAYGHGDFEVATRLEQMGVKAFAVATVDEGIRLRKYGITGEILVLGYTAPCRAKELKKYDLMQSLVDYEYAKELNSQGVTVKVHIKIDTGMHRLGFAWDDIRPVREVFEMDRIRVCGIFSHLCCADSLTPEDEAFTREQGARFYGVVEELKKSGIMVPKCHLQSSYGLLNYPELSGDYVRVGIALYGVLSAPEDQPRMKLDLRPVLTLKARVVLIRTVRRGESVSYGRTFVAERDSRIAILSIGYADGLPRNLSGGRGSAVIRRQQVPIVGRICMDQLAVDITDTEGIVTGDAATLIGAGTDGLCDAAEVADQAGSISNELLCRMGSRLPVVVKRSR